MNRAQVIRDVAAFIALDISEGGPHTAYEHVRDEVLKDVVEKIKELARGVEREGECGEQPTVPTMLLCDPDGMCRHANPQAAIYACTGSAHVGLFEIRCSNPIHKVQSPITQEFDRARERFNQLPIHAQPAVTRPWSNERS